MKAMPPSSDEATSDVGFCIEPDCCLLCGVPEDIAPEVFETGEDQCFVKRQPCSQEEVDRTIRAMWSSEVECIRYRGHDTGLIDRLARAGMADRIDHPRRPDAQPSVRGHVRFRRPVATGRSPSASQMASAFRTGMRANGKTVLSVPFARRTIWISWFQNRFHRVRIVDEGGGRFVAYLRSRIAVQGLARVVDDWLRASGAEAISWEARDDPMAACPTPM